MCCHFVSFLCSMCVLMTSSCPKCGGGQVFAVGLEEGEVGCGGAEIGGGAGSGARLWTTILGSSSWEREWSSSSGVRWY